MPSEKQTEAMKRLLAEKQLPASSPTAEEILAQFARTSTSEASTWIEKAIALPDKGDSGQPIPF